MRSKRSLVVSNTGPLIHLARTSFLHILRSLYGEIIIPGEVKVEAVDRGREKGFSDAVHVEEAINEGWMRVEKIRPSERFADIARIAGLQTAEVSVVYYAYKNRAVALIDDESARVFARTLGVTVRGSLGVVLSALKEGLMSGEEALKALDKLSDVMYLAPNVYMLAKKGVKRLRGKNLREHGSAGRHRR